MNFDQGEFDFDAPGDEAGYRHWCERLDRAKRDFEHRWGVILDRPVRISLDGHARSIEGAIHLVSPPRSDPGADVRLRVGTLTFHPREVEAVVAL
jgi:hypothetical protein